MNLVGLVKIEAVLKGYWLAAILHGVEISMTSPFARNTSVKMC